MYSYLYLYQASRASSYSLFRREESPGMNNSNIAQSIVPKSCVCYDTQLKELPAGFFGSSSWLSQHTLQCLLQLQALW